MALRGLILRKRLDAKKAELEALRAKDADFETREATLTAAVNEMSEETPDEDRRSVEESVEAFDTERKEHEDAKTQLVDEISKLEEDLAKEDEESQRGSEKPHEEREVHIMPNVRRFDAMSIEERTAFCQREEVKTWLDQVRSIGRESRAVSGADATIPTVMLPLIQESIERHSKLMKHVKRKVVKGKARQNVIAQAPEAFWTEMTAAIKELTITFNDPIECDGYKVAGYVPVANSILDDSDVSLAAELVDQIGEGIGYALDKAIFCGKGSASKMPQGFATSIASAQNTTITAANSTGTTLFQQIIKAFGKAKHGRGEKFWVMNETTKTTLLAESVGVNSAAAIVAGMNDQMPVLGGAIETLDFIPDNMIFGGYGDNYLLVEREGMAVDKSEHAQFIEDNTVFRGKARYDGKPVFQDSFVGIGISATAPAVTSVTFAGES